MTSPSPSRVCSVFDTWKVSASDCLTTFNSSAIDPLSMAPCGGGRSLASNKALSRRCARVTRGGLTQG